MCYLILVKVFGSEPVLSQFSRAQCLKLLGLTGHQFDYLIKQTGIRPKKIGRSVIITIHQLVCLKVSLRLKEYNFSWDVIKFFMELVSLENDKHQIVQYSKITNYVRAKNYLIIHADNKVDSKFYVKISDRTSEDIPIKARCFAETENKGIYVLITHNEIVDIIKELKQAVITPLNLHIDEVCQELQESADLYEIKIPELV